MARIDATCVADVRNGVGESPVWCADESALVWTDITGRALYRLSWPDAKLTRWDAPEMIGALARTANGGWIVSSESSVGDLRFEANGRASFSPRARFAHHATPMRSNDGRCDRQGRFWCSSMHLNIPGGHAVGAFYRFDGDRMGNAVKTPMERASSTDTGAGTAAASSDLPTLARRVTGLIIANGCAFSPDGRTMYLADAHVGVQQVWACDYDLASGTPSNRRVFIDMRQHPGRPDGAAIDTDGCYWIAAPDAGQVHRFTPAGKLDYSVTVPVKKPTMCAFGGADMRTLFITSICPPNTDLGDQPQAGGLFMAQVPAQGIAEASFAG
jgi:sugar lactone lactonase YvrE